MKIERAYAQALLAEKNLFLISEEEISDVLLYYGISEYKSKDEVLEDIKIGELPYLDESAIKIEEFSSQY